MSKNPLLKRKALVILRLSKILGADLCANQVETLLAIGLQEKKYLQRGICNETKNSKLSAHHRRSIR